MNEKDARLILEEAQREEDEGRKFFEKHAGGIRGDKQLQQQQHQSRINQSLTKFKRSLVLREAILGRYDRHTVRSYEWIGRAYQKLGDINRAIAAYRTCVRIHAFLYGKCTGPINSLFRDLLQESSGLTNSQMEEINKDVATSVQFEVKGDIWRRTGNRKLAFKEYEEAARLEECSFGRENPELAYLWRKLACLAAVKRGFVGMMDFNRVDRLNLKWFSPSTELENSDKHKQHGGPTDNHKIYVVACDAIRRGDVYYSQFHYDNAVAEYYKATRIAKKCFDEAVKAEERAKKQRRETRGRRRGTSKARNSAPNETTTKRASSGENRRNNHRRRRRRSKSKTNSNEESASEKLVKILENPFYGSNSNSNSNSNVNVNQATNPVKASNNANTQTSSSIPLRISVTEDDDDNNNSDPNKKHKKKRHKRSERKRGRSGSRTKKKRSKSHTNNKKKNEGRSSRSHSQQHRSTKRHDYSVDKNEALRNVHSESDLAANRGCETKTESTSCTEDSNNSIPTVDCACEPSSKQTTTTTTIKGIKMKPFTHMKTWFSPTKAIAAATKSKEAVAPVSESTPAPGATTTAEKQQQSDSQESTDGNHLSPKDEQSSPTSIAIIDHKQSSYPSKTKVDSAPICPAPSSSFRWDSSLRVTADDTAIEVQSTMPSDFQVPLSKTTTSGVKDLEGMVDSTSSLTTGPIGSTTTNTTTTSTAKVSKEDLQHTHSTKTSVDQANEKLAHSNNELHHHDGSMETLDDSASLDEFMSKASKAVSILQAKEPSLTMLLAHAQQISDFIHQQVSTLNKELEESNTNLAEHMSSNDLSRVNGVDLHSSFASATSRTNSGEAVVSEGTAATSTAFSSEVEILKEINRLFQQSYRLLTVASSRSSKHASFAEKTKALNAEHSFLKGLRKEFQKIHQSIIIKANATSNVPLPLSSPVIIATTTTTNIDKSIAPKIFLVDEDRQDSFPAVDIRESHDKDSVPCPTLHLYSPNPAVVIRPAREDLSLLSDGTGPPSVYEDCDSEQ